MTTHRPVEIGEAEVAVVYHQEQSERRPYENRIENCFLEVRKDQPPETPILYFPDGWTGRAWVHLVGYAVIPIEDHSRLKQIEITARHARFQGIAVALAEAQRQHDEPQIVVDVLNGFGISIGDLEAAGVEEYDMAVIRQCFGEAVSS